MPCSPQNLSAVCGLRARTTVAAPPPLEMAITYGIYSGDLAWLKNLLLQQFVLSYRRVVAAGSPASLLLFCQIFPNINRPGVLSA